MFASKCINGFVVEEQEKTILAQSTVEAQYFAIPHATKRLLWLRSFHNDSTDDTSATFLYEDNHGRIAVTNIDMCHDRSKQMDVKFHFIRQHVRGVTVQLAHINAQDILADITTKQSEFQKDKFFSEKLAKKKVVVDGEGEYYTNGPRE